MWKAQLISQYVIRALSYQTTVLPIQDKTMLQILLEVLKELISFSSSFNQYFTTGDSPKEP